MVFSFSCRFNNAVCYGLIVTKHIFLCSQLIIIERRVWTVSVNLFLYFITIGYKQFVTLVHLYHNVNLIGFVFIFFLSFIYMFLLSLSIEEGSLKIVFPTSSYTSNKLLYSAWTAFFALSHFFISCVVYMVNEVFSDAVYYSRLKTTQITLK